MVWWATLVSALTKPVLSTILEEFKSSGRRKEMRRMLRQRVILPRVHQWADPEQRRKTAELFVFSALNLSQEAAPSIMQMIGLWMLKQAWIPEKIKAIEMILEERAPEMEDIKVIYDDDEEVHRVKGDDKDAMERLVRDLTRILWGI